MSIRFKNMLNELGISYTDEMLIQFDRYYEILIEWNKFMNLTGITEYDEVICKHFIDSLSIVKAVNMKNISTMIDVGTGAGFPGIPIKIMFPYIHITLLDSLNKRVKFLDEVIDQLQLNNIVTLHGRAEDYARKKEYREKFELCVSRAVANLSSLSEYCIPYVKEGGLFISYKSSTIEDEIISSKKAIKILGGEIHSITRFNLPDTEIDRSLISIKKIRRTEKKYPRKAGIPTKEPLQ